MKFVRRLFMGIGGLAAVGLALTLLSPRAHALAAALVQVANTTANPVPVFNTGRAAYQSYKNVGCSDPNFCSATFDPPPPGYRLVIENLSGEFAVSNPPGTPPRLILQSSGINGPIFAGVGSLGSTFSGQTEVGFNLNFKAYVPAGASPLFTATGYIALQDPLNVTLTGYLENCAITGCP